MFSSPSVAWPSHEGRPGFGFGPDATDLLFFLLRSHLLVFFIPAGVLLVSLGRLELQTLHGLKSNLVACGYFMS